MLELSNLEKAINNLEYWLYEIQNNQIMLNASDQQRDGFRAGLIEMKPIMIDITNQELQVIMQILHKLVPNYEVWSFGSRVKWTTRPSSDLDIAIVANDNQHVNYQLLYQLKNAFSDSNLPFSVDVIDFNATNVNFQNIIKQKYVILHAPYMLQTAPKLRFKIDDGSNYPDWEEKKLGDIGEIITGNTPDTNNLDNYSGNRLFVSPVDILNQRYITNTKTTLSEQGFLATRAIKKNSILFVCIGSTIGKIAQNKYECATNQQINSIIPFADYSNEFIYSTLEHHSKQIAKFASCQAVPIINKTSFSLIKIYIPRLLEQQKIADFLTSVDDLITITKQQLELMKQYKQGIMQQIFSQQLRFKADDGTNYPDWESILFSQCFKHVTIKKYQIATQDINSDGLYRVIDQGQQFIAGYSNEQSKIFSQLPIIVYGDHTTRVKYIDFNFIIGGDGVKLLYNCRNKDNLKFLYYHLLYSNIRPEGYKRHYSILQSIILFLPSLPEQQKIAEFLTAIDDSIQQQTAKLEQIESYKKALLQQMLI